MEKANTRISPSPTNQAAVDIDFHKLFAVIRKSLPWSILIVAVFLLTAYLYLRYTKPVFESTAEIKLDIQSEASTFGFKGLMGEESNNSMYSISGEIELIRSKLFLNKVIENLPLEVTYSYIGNILDEEKYRNSPIEITCELIPEWVYDRDFEIQIIDNSKYQITFSPGQKEQKIYEFDKKYKLDDFTFSMKTNDHFADNFNGVKFSLRINSNQALLKYIDNNLAVAPLNVSANTIKVSFQDHNRTKARDIVHAVSTLYTKFSEEEKNRANQQKIAFLNEQLQITENKLEEFETYFEEFTIDNRSVNLQSDLQDIIRQTNKLDSVQFNLRESLRLFRGLRQQVQKDSLTLFALSSRAYGPEISEQIRLLNELLTDRELKMNSYNARSMIIQRLDDEINIIKNNLLALIDQQLNFLAERLSRTRSQRDELEKSFIALPGKSTSYNKNRRFYNLYEENYLALIQKKNEFEIARAGTVTKVYILSPATSPSTPIKPRVLIIYAGAAMLGLFFSLLFIIVRFMLDDRISSIEELERYNKQPVLGSIPKFKKQDGSNCLMVQMQPRSAVAESFRKIRANLEFALSGKPPYIISITSTMGGEGKSCLAANLGAIIAASGKKVVMIDLDMRKPSLHQIFDHEYATEGGLSTMLIDKHTITDVIKYTGIERLDYIPSGPIPPNPSELLSSNIFDKIIDTLKQHYDFIIIDTPPIGLVTEAVFALKKSDLPLYVVRQNYSKRSFLKNINKLVEMNGFKNLSVVFNADDSSASRLGYKYGYYADQQESSRGFSWRTIFSK